MVEDPRGRSLSHATGRNQTEQHVIGRTRHLT